MATAFIEGQVRIRESVPALHEQPTRFAAIRGLGTARTKLARPAESAANGLANGSGCRAIHTGSQKRDPLLRTPASESNLRAVVFLPHVSATSGGRRAPRTWCGIRVEAGVANVDVVRVLDACERRQLRARVESLKPAHTHVLGLVASLPPIQPNHRDLGLGDLGRRPTCVEGPRGLGYSPTVMKFSVFLLLG